MGVAGRVVARAGDYAVDPETAEADACAAGRARPRLLCTEAAPCALGTSRALAAALGLLNARTNATGLPNFAMRVRTTRRAPRSGRWP